MELSSTGEGQGRYTALHETLRASPGVYVDGRGVLSLQGEESIDFLQRLSTNDVTPLRGGTIVRTLLTTEKGRIIDRCLLLPGEGGIRCVVGRGRSEAVAAWLQKYVIMEDITVKDVSAEHMTCYILGPQQETSMSPDPDWPLTEIERRGEAWGLRAYLAERTEGEREIRRRVDDGRLLPLPEELFDAARIVHGLVQAGTDAGEGENPLESPLREDVSFSKGCYIGQEVIARIDTYKKLQKRLHTLVLEAPADRRLRPGAIVAGGEESGRTTTHARLPHPWRQLAFGYLRSDAAGPFTYVDPDTGAHYPVRTEERPAW